MSDPIHFYACRNKFGCFSNFKIGSIIMDGKPWRSAEHWFQAQKYAGTEHVERIREMKRAQEAFDEGQRTDLDGKRSYSDWEKNKRQIMYRVVKAKFSQRPVFKQILLDTGDRYIAEHCEDKVWGDGKDGTGKNYLGKILMKVREELREEDKAKNEKETEQEETEETKTKEKGKKTVKRKKETTDDKIHKKTKK